MQTPKIIEQDPWLDLIKIKLLKGSSMLRSMEKVLTGGLPLKDFANGHLFFGVHQAGESLVLREWAPNAKKIYLIGEFSGWKEQEDFHSPLLIMAFGS
jgi:1,4-alpha-glucan branching enzyme